MSDQTTVYRVRDWDQLFESRGSRKHQRPLAKISLPTGLDGLVMRRLLSDPQGAAAYGVWVLLLQVAAKAPQRGVLADRTGAYSAADLMLLTGIPESQVQAALDLLCSPRIGLLELVPLEIDGPASANIGTADVDQSTQNEAISRQSTERPPDTVTATLPDSIPSPKRPPWAEPADRLPDRYPGEVPTMAELQKFQPLLQSPLKRKRPRILV